jgi:hypothetical protein
MNSGPPAFELAVVAVFCILTIFLFPAMQGPYSAVHGPVTALQAARSAARLRFAIVQSASHFSPNSLLPSLVQVAWIPALAAELKPLSMAECDSILRC